MGTLTRAASLTPAPPPTPPRPASSAPQLQRGVLLSTCRPVLVLPAGSEVAEAEVGRLAEAAEAAGDTRQRASLDAFLRDVGLVVAWQREQRQQQEADGDDQEAAGQQSWPAAEVAAAHGPPGWLNHTVADVVAAAERAARYALARSMPATAELLLPGFALAKEPEAEEAAAPTMEAGEEAVGGSKEQAAAPGVGKPKASTDPELPLSEALDSAALLHAPPVQNLRGAPLLLLCSGLLAGMAVLAASTSLSGPFMLAILMALSMLVTVALAGRVHVHESISGSGQRMAALGSDGTRSDHAHERCD